MSTQRRCDFWKATDGKWYLLLGNFEYAEDEEDCTCYGPFSSQEAAEKELDNHSNPGGWNEDDSGKRPPPKNCRKRSASSFGNFYRR